LQPAKEPIPAVIEEEATDGHGCDAVRARLRTKHRKDITHLLSILSAVPAPPWHWGCTWGLLSKAIRPD
jgi:hypothetical protein